MLGKNVVELKLIPKHHEHANAGDGQANLVLVGKISFGRLANELGKDHDVETLLGFWDTKPISVL